MCRNGASFNLKKNFPPGIWYLALLLFACDLTFFTVYYVYMMCALVCHRALSTSNCQIIYYFGTPYRYEEPKSTKVCMCMWAYSLLLGACTYMGMLLLIFCLKIVLTVPNMNIQRRQKYRFDRPYSNIHTFKPYALPGMYHVGYVKNLCHFVRTFFMCTSSFRAYLIRLIIRYPFIPYLEQCEL